MVGPSMDLDKGKAALGWPDWLTGWLASVATQATVSPTQETMASSPSLYSPTTVVCHLPMCALLSRAELLHCDVWEQIDRGDSRVLPPRGSEVVVTPVSRQRANVTPSQPPLSLNQHLPCPKDNANKTIGHRHFASPSFVKNKIPLFSIMCVQKEFHENLQKLQGLRIWSNWKHRKNAKMLWYHNIKLFRWLLSFCMFALFSFLSYCLFVFLSFCLSVFLQMTQLNATQATCRSICTS